MRVYGQVTQKLSRPKWCRQKPESCWPKFIVISPEILSHVARNFIERLNLKKSNILSKSLGINSINVDSWHSGCSFRCRYHGDINPKIEHENKKNSYISYSMVLTVVVLSVEAFCFERRFTLPRLEHWKTSPSWIQHGLKNHHMVAKQDCEVAGNSDTHE